jgi:hypothetical protein
MQITSMEVYRMIPWNCLIICPHGAGTTSSKAIEALTWQVRFSIQIFKFKVLSDGCPMYVFVTSLAERFRFLGSIRYADPARPDLPRTS